VKGSWDKFTWLAARRHADVTDDVLAYASVSTGFKSGNIEDGGLLADPETLTNYEVGSKIRFMDGRATLNLAAYYEDFKGYQVNQVVTIFKPDGTVASSQVMTTNAKGAQAYGIEAELTANLTANDRLQISATAQDTKMDELMSADGRIGPNDAAHAVQLKGNELPHAPHFSGTVAYEHIFELERPDHPADRHALRKQELAVLLQPGRPGPTEGLHPYRRDPALRTGGSDPGRLRPSSRTSRTRTSRPGPAPPACRTTLRSGRRLPAAAYLGLPSEDEVLGRCFLSVRFRRTERSA
jgi:hypothetical protein